MTCSFEIWRIYRRTTLPSSNNNRTDGYLCFKIITVLLLHKTCFVRQVKVHKFMYDKNQTVIDLSSPTSKLKFMIAVKVLRKIVFLRCGYTFCACIDNYKTCILKILPPTWNNWYLRLSFGLTRFSKVIWVNFLLLRLTINVVTNCSQIIMKKNMDCDIWSWTQFRTPLG